MTQITETTEIAIDPTRGSISNGRLLKLSPDARHAKIISLPADVRRSLTHIAVLGAQRLVEKAADAADKGLAGTLRKHLERAHELNALAIELTSDEL